ncbi:hypothetical protein N8T08_005632 [Aspergillus melleus]|uniref:Uncharacterized protein n=1 Tax=Aspergillus melleus TaxID=138277 RepID=A0ACC3B1U8_9EURO|nr:hypothetical protein N8T08_005632 [Aspergillus melleus]
MIPLLYCSGLCACCDIRPDHDYDKCPKCDVAIYCDEEAIEEDKKDHEAECAKICSTVQWYHEMFQGGLRKLVLEEIGMLSRHRVMHGYNIPATEYVFAYFCQKHLPLTEMPMVELRKELLLFRELLRLHMVFPKVAQRQIPTILLQLGQDEMCYDFIRQGIRWEPERSISKVLKCGLAYRDPKGNDPFYDETFFCKDFIDLEDIGETLIRCVGVAFIKVKMLLDLETLEAATYTVGSLVPRETLIQIKAFAATNWYVERSQHLIEEDRPTKAREVLMKQIGMLFTLVNRLDCNFWPHLIFEAPVSSGQESKTLRQVVHNVARLWVCHPRALQFMAAMMRRHYRDNLEGWQVRTGPPPFCFENSGHEIFADLIYGQFLV